MDAPFLQFVHDVLAEVSEDAATKVLIYEHLRDRMGYVVARGLYYTGDHGRAGSMIRLELAEMGWPPGPLAAR